MLPRGGADFGSLPLGIYDDEDDDDAPLSSGPPRTGCCARLHDMLIRAQGYDGELLKEQYRVARYVPPKTSMHLTGAIFPYFDVRASARRAPCPPPAAASPPPPAPAAARRCR